MCRIRTIFVFGLLCALGGTAIASDSADKAAQDNKAQERVVPVYVHVDDHGNVTDAVPAVRLSAQLTKLMRKNLDEMINAPAKDAKGNPIASQLAIMLSLKTAQDEKGNFSAQFTYVSAKPVPTGTWYWVEEDGHRWALARSPNRTYTRQIRESAPESRMRQSGSPPPSAPNPPPKHP